MGRVLLQPELADQPGQARRLTGRKLEHEPAQSGGIDDRMLEGSREAAGDDPGVEGVVAVLDEHRATGEMEKSPPGVAEFRGADEHLALDEVAAARVGVDGSTTVHESVEEGERGVEAEALGADLEHQKRTVAGGLDVDGDKLGFGEGHVGADTRRVGVRIFPGHRLGAA